MNNNYKPKVEVELHFKKIIWNNGSDWSDGSIQSFGRMVMIKMNGDLKRIDFERPFEHLSVCFSEKLNLEESCGEKSGINSDTGIFGLQRIAERRLQDYIYKTFFDFVSE